MIIHHTLMSCDESPFYKDFIPVITSAWNKLGIKPVFVIIGEEEGFEEDSEKIVFYFKTIPDIKVNFQALNARIWAWKIVGENKNCILSDIDMMPLSDIYFNGIAKQFEEDQIVSYCDDAVEKFGQIAACYILANSGVMSKLIKETTWEEFIRKRAEETGQGWGGDQFYLGELLHGCGNWPPDPNKTVHNEPYPKTVRLNRGWNEAGEAYNRLDRNTWRYQDHQIIEQKLYDAHLLRPYSDHKQEIDKLLSLIP